MKPSQPLAAVPIDLGIQPTSETNRGEVALGEVSEDDVQQQRTTSSQMEHAASANEPDKPAGNRSSFAPFSEAEPFGQLVALSQHGTDALLYPASVGFASIHQWQTAAAETVKDARHYAVETEALMRAAETTFEKLPQYTEKLEKIKRNLKTLQHNVHKVHVSAAEIRAEVDEYLRSANAPPTAT